jgi:hypothetical protein
MQPKSITYSLNPAIETKLCYIDTVKVYELPNTEDYEDKTPMIEIWFKESIEHGAIKLKLELKSYLTIQDEIGNLKEVRFSQDEFKYQIDSKTNKRIINSLKTIKIEQVLSKIFYCLGFKEGSAVNFEQMIGRKALVSTKNNRVINIQKP